MKTNEERVRDLLGYLGSLSHVKPEEIPDIDLYMDQVTTFMESHLKDMRRHPEDKVLTKTMINNYAPASEEEVFQGPHAHADIHLLL